ncbi:DUF397 domain-containing protein [Amycolatopsis cihanbeyliensis]|uniref:Uncharacterized protein DUF397 n=1 Tax=Amycolatopsis cihanbeyliensis TaxID=1128664 RepID=A0A542DM17_AMYCI|nr:DUF397 domain-containing protein [Amycolatopsis cihanbeyliensis]TQJ04129.1 uncharacterized protein DUF397 [Amycolatopsis cihanbeyliensis]
MAEPVFAGWRKSSYSDGAGEESDCVEVATAGPVVGVRDSKDPAGPPLAFTRGAWTRFLIVLR